MLCSCVDSAIGKKGKMEYRLERKRRRMRVTKKRVLLRKELSGSVTLDTSERGM